MKTLVVLAGFLMLVAVAATPPAALADNVAPPAKGGSSDQPASQAQSQVNIPDIPENQAEIEAGLVPQTTPAAEATAAARVLSPLMVEIQAVLADEQTKVAELQARLEAATDDHAALALQKEIEQIKVETELNILRLQATYARNEGRIEQAAEIEAVIAEMLSPRPVGVPIERPAPTQGNPQR
jgi:hypothetical protein